MGSARIILIEFGLVAASFALALVWPGLGGGLFAAAERRFVSLARHRRTAIVVTAAAALFVGGVCRIPEGIPRPQQYDEFSYLLAADTFSRGRLTNPTHPLWEHFESFHINQKPTYISMYQPGQGMTLAAGKLIFGHPWFGVWISVAAMCAAIVWMLQGWLPPGWALLGGAIAITRIAAYSYWIEGYWGGSVAAFGGALTLGALPRMLRRWRARDSLLLGAGVVILANTRPFEGLTVALPVAGALAWWLVRSPRRIVALAPLAAVVCAAAAWMLYYNFRLTGSPFELAYTTNRAQYAVAGVFVWQDPYPVPQYRHKVLRDFYTGWELTGFNLSRGWSKLETNSYEKIFKAWMFFLGPVFTIALFPAWRVARDRRVRPLLLIGAASAAMLATAVYANPHYWAPQTALIYALLLQGLRHVRQLRFRGKLAGLAIVRAIPVICVLMLVVRTAAAPLKWDLILGVPTWYSRFTPDYRREDLIASLKALGGKHLVVVRYAPDHVAHQDWVYNDADIDGSPIVWAREMNMERNARLLDYFKDRSIWLLEPDKDLLKLTPYRQGSD